MKTTKQTGEQSCENRSELAKKYFDTFGDGIKSVYAEGNMGIVTLLSDLQHEVDFNFENRGKAEYWRCILNDIKCILINEERKAEDEIH